MSAVRRTSLTIAALLLQSAAMQSAQTYKIIANSSIDVKALSRSEVSQLFMRKSLKWPDGSLAVPVDLPVGSATRESFSRDVHGKTTTAVDAFWQKQVFSGRDLPPITKPSDAEVADYVRATPGAVGYVADGTETAGLRTIRVQ